MPHTGGCHCGAVRFETDLELGPVMACNCSICSRAGWLLTFTSASSFTLLQGEDSLTDYQFGKKSTHHVFCKTCGVRPFSYGAAPDGSRAYGVNARCLDGVDTSTLEVQHFDGASM